MSEPIKKARRLGRAVFCSSRGCGLGRAALIAAGAFSDAGAVSGRLLGAADLVGVYGAAFGALVVLDGLGANLSTG